MKGIYGQSRPKNPRINALTRLPSTKTNKNAKVDPSRCCCSHQMDQHITPVLNGDRHLVQKAQETPGAQGSEEHFSLRHLVTILPHHVMGWAGLTLGGGYKKGGGTIQLTVSQLHKAHIFVKRERSTPPPLTFPNPYLSPGQGGGGVT